MKYQQNNDNYTLIFKKGESFISTLEKFCSEHDISAGFFHGLGGVLSAEIGYYHLDTREYEFHKLDEVLEIVSLHGNIAIKDDKAFVHTHGVLAGPDLKTYGGHIKEMIIGGTCELQLQVISSKWHRNLDEDTGLSLIDFDE
ncbi:MAG: PPC domain-containing DNA-binding protein [Candidatus Saccharimonadales bacterium]